MSFSGLFNRHKNPSPKQMGKELLAEMKKPAGKADVEKALGLIRDGAQVDLVNLHGNTALIFAARNGHALVVRALLAKGADPDQSSNCNNTALHEAASAGHKDIVIALADAGADLNGVNTSGYTALHYTAWRNQKDAAGALIDKGAKLDKKMSDGTTPLMLARHFQHTDISNLIAEAVAHAKAPREPEPERKPGSGFHL